MPPRRRGKLTGLSELIPKIIPASEPEDARAMRVFGAFCRSVSERVLSNARPVRFSDGVLMVNTSTSTWANALTFETPDLLGKIRARVPGITVTRIAFRSGPLPELPAAAPLPPRIKPLGLDTLPPQVARELASIGHDGLRDAVARAAATALSIPGTQPTAKKKK
jgi:hypothetical protein